MALIREVCAEHGVKLAEILSPDRPANIVRAREAAIRRVHAERPNLSYPQLGELFGRDHSSIAVALDRSGGRVTRSDEWRKARYESAAGVV